MNFRLGQIATSILTFSFFFKKQSLLFHAFYFQFSQQVIYTCAGNKAINKRNVSNLGGMFNQKCKSNSKIQ